MNFITSRFAALLLSPVLVLQGMWVKHRTPRLEEAAGPREGHAGDGDTLHLVALGDSIIAGVGVETTAQALTARLSAAMAKRLACRVRWSSHGRNGARTRDLVDMEAAPHWKDARLLVISNGLNDVTALARLEDFIFEKSVLYERLKSLSPGALIVQAGIPPLGDFPALPQPLRAVFGERARTFDRALADLIEPMENILHLPFTDVPDPAMFAADGYHPGPGAIAIWAESLAAKIAVRLHPPRT